MSLAFYVTLLTLTTLIWGYIFYKNDYHPQPFKVIAHSVLVGLFAMAPVFAYQYLYKNFLPMLAEYQIFRPLLDSPFVRGLLVFGGNLIALSLLLLILSGILSALLNFYNHAALRNLKNALKDEPMGFVMVSFLLGLIIYLQNLTQQFFSLGALGAVLGSILFLAIIEEYIKHLMVRLSDDKKIKDIDDAITLSIVVGLAFAFVETLFYGVIAGQVELIFYRMLVTLPIHLVTSGIFGYFYGLAHFAVPITRAEGGEKIKGGHFLPKILSLKRSTLFHEEKMIEGIFFATLFHAGINLLFEFNLGFLAVPLIVFGIAAIFRLYKKAHAEDSWLKSWRMKWRKA